MEMTVAKTAKERLSTDKPSKIVVLDKDFAGIKAGQTMFVATPELVKDYIERIPFGEVRTISRLRRELAKEHECDACCPVSTAIFLRIAAQAAIDEMASGVETENVTPFWRVLSSNDKIAKKLTIDGQWVDQQREIEASS